MRIIKFLFWHKTLCKMSGPHGLGVIWEYLCHEWGGPFDWKEVEKRQYTGLHDLAGKEIYEGDIEEIFGTAYIITWNSRQAGWHGLTVNDERYCTAEMFCDGEVAGNIYEDPGLLK